ncbi:hypothetical protein, partial [Burkholderia contaminans]|uniref:hypothetical protein n=1 Tax=Burkholderia contaminans TaxID=488447 RepID=UPI0021BBC1C6
CQASCGGSPWFPVREVGPGNPILSDSTGEPPPSTFNYAWDIAEEKLRAYKYELFGASSETRHSD